jgi:hypothetical protein
VEVVWAGALTRLFLPKLPPLCFLFFHFFLSFVFYKGKR